MGYYKFKSCEHTKTKLIKSIITWFVVHLLTLWLSIWINLALFFNLDISKTNLFPTFGFYAKIDSRSNISCNMCKNMKIFLFLKLLLTQGWNSTLKHGSFLNVVNYVLQLIPSCRTFKNRFVATPTLMKIKWKRELVHNGSMLICQTTVAFVPCKMT